MTKVQLSKEAVAAFEQWNLDPANFDPGRGILINKNRQREVRVLRGDGRPTLYLKWFPAPKRRCPAFREARIHRRCQQLGLPVATVAATVSRHQLGAFLFLQEMPGKALDEWVSQLDRDGRGRLWRKLAASIAGWHALGFQHRQLFSWHIHVAGTSFALLDLACCRLRGRPLSPAARARDLASLWVTLPREVLNAAARQRFLKSYGLDQDQQRRLQPALRWWQRRLHLRGRFPRQPAGREWQQDGGRLYVHPSVQRVVEQSSTRVEDWLRPAGAKIVRQRDGRVNLRWAAPPGGGPPWFGKLFQFPRRRGPSPAWRETYAYRLLAWSGIATPEVVLVGREQAGPSVIWTRGILPGVSARDRCHGDSLRPSTDARRLLRQAAMIASRLHRAGISHGDLYLDHFLCQGDECPALVLIDPGRVTEHLRLPRRKRLKDLAALEYSARTANISRTDRLRAWHAYRVCHRMKREDLILVIRRANRVQRRQRQKGLDPVPLPDTVS